MAAQGTPREAIPLSPEAARQLDACVRCGFCLAACPTFRELGAEADSPRGRIDLVAALARGEVAPSDPAAALHLDRCLDCRACESACPSGVRYHLLLQAAVQALPARRPGPRDPGAVPPALLRLGLAWLVPRPRLLRWAVRRVARWRRLPASVARLARHLPRRPRSARYELPAFVSARGRRRGAVDLFLGCVQDACCGADNLAAVAVLTAWGFDVHIPRRQTCCGALHAHVGDLAGWRRLALRNARAFPGDRPVVACAAGCSAVLKEYGRWEGAAALATRVRDLGEFLAAVPAEERPRPRPPAAAPLRLAYHDPCHLAHAQGIRRAPRELLDALPGVVRVELEEADACCGSAGVYNLLQPGLAGRILERKVDAIRAAAVARVVTANPGCLLQLRAGLAEAGVDVEVVGLAQVLAEAYAPEAAADG